MFKQWNIAIMMFQVKFIGIILHVRGKKALEINDLSIHHKMQEKSNQIKKLYKKVSI